MEQKDAKRKNDFFSHFYKVRKFICISEWNKKKS